MSCEGEKKQLLMSKVPTKQQLTVSNIADTICQGIIKKIASKSPKTDSSLFLWSVFQVGQQLQTTNNRQMLQVQSSREMILNLDFMFGLCTVVLPVSGCATGLKVQACLLLICI